MPDIVCGETSAGLFLYWSWEDRGCELALELAFLIIYGYRGSLLWLRAGWLLTGSPLRPRQPPLGCLLLLVFPVCSLVLADQGGGQRYSSLSVLGGPWALGTVSPWR